MKYVEPELAETLQKLGYDGPFNLMYFDTPAPRLDDVAYWIREKYGIHIAILPNIETEDENSYCYQVWEYFRNDEFWSSTYYSANLSHDDALGSAINKAIKVIKQQEYEIQKKASCD